MFLVNLLKNPGDAGRLDSRVTVIPAKAVKILYLDRLCEPDPRNKTKACSRNGRSGMKCPPKAVSASPSAAVRARARFSRSVVREGFSTTGTQQE